MNTELIKMRALKRIDKELRNSNKPLTPQEKYFLFAIDKLKELENAISEIYRHNNGTGYAHYHEGQITNICKEILKGETINEY